MKYEMKSLFVRMAALLLLSMGLSACGYKSLPIPPQGIVPLTINDLRYELKANGVTLYWTYPTRTVTGDKITNINTFILYRAEVPVDAYCNTCPIPFGPPITLPGGSLPNKGNRTGSYDFTALRPNTLYFFKLRSTTGWMAESADSNLVSFMWEKPPAPPRGLEATKEPEGVRLRWQAVDQHRDGTALKSPVRYQVSRSLEGGSFENIGNAVTTTSYTDRSTESGLRYAYRVQAVTGQQHGILHGPASAVVQVETTQARLLPPNNVKATRTASSVKVYWDMSRDKKNAGYRIYRRVGNETQPQKIGEAQADHALYEDLQAPPRDVSVFYSVSTFDHNKPAQESQPSPEVVLQAIQ
jgi:uncharacterized protein